MYAAFSGTGEKPEFWYEDSCWRTCNCMLKLLHKNLEERVQLVCSRNRDCGLGRGPWTCIFFFFFFFWNLLLYTACVPKTQEWSPGR